MAVGGKVGFSSDALRSAQQSRHSAEWWGPATAMTVVLPRAVADTNCQCCTKARSDEEKLIDHVAKL
jgi:hypothetical protein